MLLCGVCIIKVHCVSSHHSCYNKCVKLFFFGFKLFDSFTAVLIETGLPSFNTLLYNSNVIFFQNVGIPAPYIIRSLAICLLLIIAFDCILCLLLQLLVVLYAPLSLICICMICVFFVCVLVYAFMYFYVYMGQVPEIKLMMMMTSLVVVKILLSTDDDDDDCVLACVLL